MPHKSVRTGSDPSRGRSGLITSAGGPKTTMLISLAQASVFIGLLPEIELVTVYWPLTTRGRGENSAFTGRNTAERPQICGAPDIEFVVDYRRRSHNCFLKISPAEDLMSVACLQHSNHTAI